MGRDTWNCKITRGGREDQRQILQCIWCRIYGVEEESEKLLRESKHAYTHAERKAGKYWVLDTKREESMNRVRAEEGRD